MREPLSIEAIIKTVVTSIDQHKGEDIVVLNMEPLQTFTDHFVICTANNKPHAQSLAGYIEEDVKKEHGIQRVRGEGEREGEWILLDYGDFVVHIFQNQYRQYYGLENLWGDAEIADIDALLYA